MVSILKNLAIGALTQLNANSDKRRETAQKEADEIRQANLNFSINDELNKNNSNRALEKEKERLRYESQLKQQETERQYKQFQAIMSGGTMPAGGQVVTPEVPTEGLAPLPDQPQVNIDDPDVDPATASDDPVVNELTRQYNFLVSTGKFNEALNVRSEIRKHEKKVMDDDPVTKGKKEVQGLQAQVEEAKKLGWDDKKINSVILKNKPVVDSAYVGKLKLGSEAMLSADDKLSRLEQVISENPQAVNEIARKVNTLRKGVSQFTDEELTLGVDPKLWEAMQEIVSISNLATGDIKPVAGEVGAMTQKDLERIQNTLAANVSWTTPATALSAIKTIRSELQSKLAQNADAIGDPGGDGTIRRINKHLYGSETKPGDETEQPTLEEKAVYDQTEPGESYTFRGQTYVKGK